jgi:hypothetical protein
MYPHADDLALIPFELGPDGGAAHVVLTPDPRAPRRRALRRDRRGRLTDQYHEMPCVTEPERSAPLHQGPVMAELRDHNFGRNVEFREARFEPEDPQMEEWRRSIVRAAGTGDA